MEPGKIYRNLINMMHCGTRLLAPRVCSAATGGKLRTRPWILKRLEGVFNPWIWPQPMEVGDSQPNRLKVLARRWLTPRHQLQPKP